MRIWMLVVVCLGISVLLAGCVPSVHPLFTPKTIVFDKTLVGTWAEKDSPDDTWVFNTASDGKSYELAYTENGHAARFEAHLVRIGSCLFLDTFPSAEGPDQNTLKVIHLFPAHIFYRVKIEGDSVSVRPFDPEWLQKMLQQKKLTIAHETSNGDILLTAQTTDLQALFRKYGGNESAFQKPGANLLRKKQ